MTLLDRYILREWLKVFAMTLIALIGLLLIGRAFDDVPDFLRWESPVSLALHYFALQVPFYLPVVLPVSLLISVLFVLGYFHRNRELTAMRAAGMSIFRITRPLWRAGIALSLLLLALNATIVPWATEEALLLSETAEFDYRSREMQKGSGTAKAKSTVQFYSNNKDLRVWAINQFSGYTGRAFGLSIHQSNAAGKPVKAWLARLGHYDAAGKSWVLEDGRILEFDSLDGRIISEPRFTRLVMSDWTEDPRLMLALNKIPSDLSINEIRNVLDHAGMEKSSRILRYEVQYHYVLASPFCCLVIVGLAVPFAVAGVRVNPMVGVSKSLLLFALYFFLSRVCALLGEQQHLPPMLAAWMPNLAMFALAIHLCRRVN
ncbi:MAG: LptF/LptG family permease [Puniceicoccales bacterium]|jgi:lipopolysaccharide export system permease protein|nr:LptF/LptG family permease [Puniceicoccales bacterium]